MNVLKEMNALEIESANEIRVQIQAYFDAMYENGNANLERKKTIRGTDNLFALKQALIDGITNMYNDLPSSK